MTKKRKELTEQQRDQIIGAWKCGVKPSAIIKNLKLPQSTVYDVVTLYKKTGQAKPPPRPGRPPKLTGRDIRHLVYLLKQDRKSTLHVLTNKFIESTSTKVCARTIRHYLHEEGYFNRVGKRKPFVNKEKCKIRLEWVKERMNWKKEWKTIIWSDESRFEVYGGDGRSYVWRKPKEKFDVKCLIPTFRSGRMGVMVWGCFCYYGLGPLVRVFGNMTAKDYIDILQDCYVPYLENLNSIVGEKDYIFQDDNARIHTAKLTMQWFRENEINKLSWPSTSPDLNPIEHLWDELERRIRSHIPLPKNESELFDLLQKEWFNLDGEIYINLVRSMNRRVNAVKEAKGSPSKDS